MKKRLPWSRSMKSCFILSALLFLLHVNAFAQNIVTGTLTDKTGTLVGVGVQVKGTKISTVTGTDGKYSIRVANAATDVLVFSYIGYAT